MGCTRTQSSARMLHTRPGACLISNPLPWSCCCFSGNTRSWYTRRSSSKSSPSLRQSWICPAFVSCMDSPTGVLAVYTTRHAATNPCFFNRLQAQKKLTESTGLHRCSAQSSYSILSPRAGDCGTAILRAACFPSASGARCGRQILNEFGGASMKVRKTFQTRFVFAAFLVAVLGSLTPFRLSRIGTLPSGVKVQTCPSRPWRFLPTKFGSMPVTASLGPSPAATFTQSPF